MTAHEIGTREEWLAARLELLEAEKQHLRRGDEENPGCTGCSFVADHFDGVLPHLNGHDVTLVAESIAPLDRLHAYAERMNWRFPWSHLSAATSSTTSAPRSPRGSKGKVPSTTSATSIGRRGSVRE